MKKYILGIDTSYYTSAGIAIINDYKKVKSIIDNTPLSINEQNNIIGNLLQTNLIEFKTKIDKNKFNHLESLVLLIKNLLEDAKLTLSNINQITVCIGPASYTGLRIGIVTAQMLAKAYKVDLYGTLSNTALTLQIMQNKKLKTFLTVVDAKRNEVFAYKSSCVKIADQNNTNLKDILKNIKIITVNKLTDYKNIYGELDNKIVKFEIINPAQMAFNSYVNFLSNSKNPSTAVYLRNPDVY
jgi:tRNA threonylcarbamoyl adenosine modification protein YeaZ